MTAFLDFPRPRASEGVRFWQGVTGYGLSSPRGDRDQFATLVPPIGEPQLRTQAIGGDRSRIHLDLHTGDVPGLVRRALDLGAADATEGDVPTLTSPGGIVWCAVDAPDTDDPPAAASWLGGHRSIVDQVCLDLPPAGYSAELAFWQELTGRKRHGIGDPEFERLDPVGTFRVLVQRLHDDHGPARCHLDLAADDVAAEVSRHLALGARHLYDGRNWVTLEDPTGLVYCVTNRPPRRVA